jgi:hypothetical protein
MVAAHTVGFGWRSEQLGACTARHPNPADPASAALLQAAGAGRGDDAADQGPVVSEAAAVAGHEEDDARDYFASVRECQAALDAGGPALMASALGAVPQLPAARAAGGAAAAVGLAVGMAASDSEGDDTVPAALAGAGAAVGAVEPKELGEEEIAAQPLDRKSPAGKLVADGAHPDGVTALASGAWGSSDSEASSSGDEREQQATADAATAMGGLTPETSQCTGAVLPDPVAEPQPPSVAAALTDYLPNGEAGAPLEGTAEARPAGMEAVCVAGSEEGAVVAPEDVHLVGCEDLEPEVPCQQGLGVLDLLSLD